MKTSSPTTESLLEWVKVNNSVMETECGRFRCRRYFPGEVLTDPGERCYQLYKRGIRCGPPLASFALVAQYAEDAR